MGHVKVVLMVNADHQVVTDPAPVVVDPGDTIEWRCDVGDVTVSLEQGLLDGVQKFDGKRGKPTHHGQVKKDVARGKHFECTITLDGKPMVTAYGVDTSGSGEQ
jgi:plastocyanin